MSSRIAEGLAGLEQDVAALRLAPPAEVRARGRARSRRRAAALTGAAAAVAVAGTALLPALIGTGVPGWPAGQLAATPSPTCAPEPAPVKRPHPLLDRALAQSRTAKVYLSQTATDAQRRRIGEVLRGSAGVRGVEFSDHAEQWQRFRENYVGVCGGADLIAAVGPEQLPEAFVVTLNDPSDFPQVAGTVQGLPGVDEVLRTFG
ncbi:permease-like cell division protein FtsX [Micromonospora sp. CPCC 205711]|uniref:permease-like cell division protein FtsX n=1 Tax=Micromonospora sp. CPCC 205547 TaxID=3122400 RepID=UPI002FF42BE6